MRIRQIALVAEHLAPVKVALMDLFGLEEAHIDPKIQTFGLKNIVMTLGDTFLEVVSPIQDKTTAGRLLERRGGDGGYMVIVQVEDLDHEKARLAGTDIRIVYNIDTERAKAVHLHPKDVPGAIASLDMMDPPEAWYWAGTDWGERIATNVGNITGAEIQSDDPQDTADRWALAFGRELGSSSGMPILSYDTSEVRFVKATDGRGAGLRAIDIEVKDTHALFLAAERHGLEFSDSKVTVCGTDINLV